MFITASSMNAYDKCPRLYKYRYIDQKQSSRPQPALLSGSAFHIGTQSFWEKDSLDTMLAKVSQFTGENEHFLTDAGKLDAVKVEAYVRGYHHHRSAAGPWQGLEVIGVELEWAQEFEGVEFKGKIDLLLRDSEGRIYIVDHKTSGARDVDNFSSAWWSRLRFDTQLVTYRMAMEEMIRLGKIDGSGQVSLAYDVVQKTKSKPAQKKRIAKKKSETEFQYEARKLANMETLAEYKAKLISKYMSETERYMWKEIPIPSHKYEEKVNEICEVAHEMAAPRMSYRRNQSSCTSIFGQCEFFNVCCGTETLDSPSFEDKPAHSELNQGDKNESKT